MLNKAPDAEEIPHPTFPTSGRLAAVRRSSAGLEAVAYEDDEYFDPIPIEEADVCEYVVSVPKLVELIRSQNGIDGAGESSDRGLIPIGQRNIDGYGVVEVYLSLPNSDAREFVTRCLSLARATGIRKLAVLVPRTLTLSAQERQLLDARGIVPISLSPLADEGGLAVDWESQIIESPEDRPNGVYPPRTIVVSGREYKCDLTTLETAFLDIAIRRGEVELGHIIHRGPDALWKETFANNRETRNKVTQLLSRLNRKLANARPPFPFFFSLPRGRTSIVRTSESDTD